MVYDKNAMTENNHRIGDSSMHSACTVGFVVTASVLFVLLSAFESLESMDPECSTSTTKLFIDKTIIFRSTS